MPPPYLLLSWLCLLSIFSISLSLSLHLPLPVCIPPPFCLHTWTRVSGVRISIGTAAICPRSPITFKCLQLYSSPRYGTITWDPILPTDKWINRNYFQHLAVEVYSKNDDVKRQKRNKKQSEKIFVKDMDKVKTRGVWPSYLDCWRHICQRNQWRRTQLLRLQRLKIFHMFYSETQQAHQAPPCFSSRSSKMQLTRIEWRKARYRARTRRDHWCESF